MGAVASQITSITIVHSTVYSDADQRKHQSSASLAFVRGIHRDRWIPRTNGQLRGKCFHLMTSSCLQPTLCAWLLSVTSVLHVGSTGMSGYLNGAAIYKWFMQQYSVVYIHVYRPKQFLELASQSVISGPSFSIDTMFSGVGIPIIYKDKTMRPSYLYN